MQWFWDAHAPDVARRGANRFAAAGVEMTALRYEGVFHDFMMLNALAATNANRQATARAAQALKTALFSRS